MPRLSATLFAVAISSCACTYGEPEVHVSVQNVALSADGELLAAVVKYERDRPPTGLSTFPDGGRPKTLHQRADVYVVDLARRAVVFEGSVTAPESRRLSFSPWLVGWVGRRAYFKITGCPDSFSSECYGKLVGQSIYSFSPGNAITESASSNGALLMDKINATSNYADAGAGAEAYGVSFTCERGASREPLLRFAGERLTLVPR